MIPVGAMTWRNAFFLHRRTDAEALRRLVPAGLEVDRCDGDAWLGIVGFVLAAARPSVVPRPFGYPAFGEINVRTYVTANGVGGVWFFSLDAASAIAVAFGRGGFNLPYFRARIRGECGAETTRYTLERRARNVERDPQNVDRRPQARLTVELRARGAEREPVPDTLEHFLIQRFALFTQLRSGTLRRLDVRHPTWPIRDADAAVAEETLLAADGLTAESAPWIAHVSRGVDVRGWPLLPITAPFSPGAGPTPSC